MILEVTIVAYPCLLMLKCGKKRILEWQGENLILDQIHGIHLLRILFYPFLLLANYFIMWTQKEQSVHFHLSLKGVCELLL